MAPLVVDPCSYLNPHHSVGHCHGSSFNGGRHAHAAEFVSRPRLARGDL